MLDKKLIEYSKSNMYPFHMPGHKRMEINYPNPYSIDITEIEGFDNLHNANDILREAQQRAADLYNSKQAFYLINGSTCGLLAIISAVTNKGDKVLVARNCHKAVYHGIFLRELSPIYVYPKITDVGIQGQISAKQIKEELENNSNIKAVIITSPTYDGIVSDIKAISEIVHKHNMPLIVDEAHGAHFGFSNMLPENAIKLGADAVIVSVHKTLPAFTQTALLHICSDRISISKVKKYLGIFETSSPSYILMSGIERCISIVKEDGQELFRNFIENLNAFYEEVSSLKHLKVLTQKDFSKEEAYDFDFSKIIILTEKANITGEKLLEILHKKYEIQLEMAAGNYALAIATIMDTRDGFKRLSEALMDIDISIEVEDCIRKIPNISIYYQKLEKIKEIHEIPDDIYMEETGSEKLENRNVENRNVENSNIENRNIDNRNTDKEYSCKEKTNFDERSIISVDIEEAEGKISAGFIYLYPPGIPLIVPGEQINAGFIRDLRLLLDNKLDVQGLTENNRIIILKG